MHVDFSIEPLPGNALQRLVQPPVAASNKYRHTVHRDRQRVRVGRVLPLRHRRRSRRVVGNLADAEAGVVRVGLAPARDEAQVQRVQILRPVAVGPPQLRIGYVERCGRLWIEGDHLFAARRERYGLGEAHVAEAAFERASLRLRRQVFHRCRNGNICRIRTRQRQVGRDQRVLNHHRSRRGEPNLLPQTGIAIADCPQPVPADGRKKGRPVERRNAAVQPQTVGDGVLMRHPGVRLRRHLDREHSYLAWLY